MKILAIRINDNTAKIEKVRESNKEMHKKESELNLQIQELQNEKFLEILIYIKCIYEDYIRMTGNTSFNISLHGTVVIMITNNHVYIDFNYMGTPECINTPKRMEARFDANGVQIISSTAKGINDLMERWKYIKPLFQEKINVEYEKIIKQNHMHISTLEYMKQVAENFTV